MKKPTRIMNRSKRVISRILGVLLTLVLVLTDFDGLYPIMKALAAPQTYKMEVSIYPPGAGEVIGTGTYAAGSQVMLQAIGKNGNTFECWIDYDLGEEINENPYTFKAERSRGFNLLFRGSGEYFVKWEESVGGSVNVANMNEYEAAYSHKPGTTFTLTATPQDSTYEFEYFMYREENSDSYTKINGNSFQLPSSDVYVKAKFHSKIKRTVTIDQNIEHGTITLENNQYSGTYNEGDLVKLNITPEKGYVVDGITSSISVVNGPEPGTFYMPETDIYLTAKFKKVSTSTVTACAIPDVGGTVGVSMNDAETEATLTATPNLNFRFVGWYHENDLDTKLSSDPTFKVSKADPDLAYAAKFEFDLSVSIAPSKSGTVEWKQEGNIMTLTAVPADGYRFGLWLDSNANKSSTETEYSFDFTKERPELMAYFVGENAHTLQIKQGENGTISVVNYRIYYEEGETITVNATPDEGYELETFLLGVPHTETTYMFTSFEGNSFEMPGQNAAVYAMFGKYLIDIEALPSEGGSVSKKRRQGTATVTATANDEYHFVNWTENGTVVSTSPTYTFQVENDRKLTANFEKETPIYNIETSVSPENAGTASVSREGNDVTVKVVANKGYVFDGWEENGNKVSSNMTYSFVADSDRKLTAVFHKTVDLECFVNESTAVVKSGSTIDYTFTVKNSGDCDADNVKAKVDLSSFVKLIGVSGSGQYDESSGTWTIDEIKAGAQKSFTLSVEVMQEGPIQNSVTVSSDCVDTNARNNDSSIINMVHGYQGMYVEVETRSTDVGYEWYVSSKSDLSDAKKIEGATEYSYLIPTGKEGTKEYYYCQITCGDRNKEYVSRSGVYKVTYPNPSAGLIVEKYMSDRYDEYKDFCFQITVKDREGNLLSGKIGDDVFRDGQVTFWLKPGEQKHFWALEKGYEYTVAEVLNEDDAIRYTTKVSHEELTLSGDGDVLRRSMSDPVEVTSYEGKIQSDSYEMVQFINERIAVGSAKIKNVVTVEGYPETGIRGDGTYEFTMHAMYAPSYEPYCKVSITVMNGSVLYATVAKRNTTTNEYENAVEAPLDADGYVEIRDLPPGQYYVRAVPSGRLGVLSESFWVKENLMNDVYCTDIEAHIYVMAGKGGENVSSDAMVTFTTDYRKEYAVTAKGIVQKNSRFAIEDIEDVKVNDMFSSTTYFFEAGKEATLTIDPKYQVKPYIVRKVVYNDGIEHEIKPDADGNYTFVMPEADVTFTAYVLEFQEWTDPNNMPDKGNYYLACDVTVYSYGTIAYDYVRNIAFNEHKLTIDNFNLYSEINLYEFADSPNKGGLYVDRLELSSYEYNKRPGTLSLYDGELVLPENTMSILREGTQLNLYGGKTVLPSLYVYGVLHLAGSALTRMSTVRMQQNGLIEVSADPLTIPDDYTQKKIRVVSDTYPRVVTSGMKGKHYLSSFMCDPIDGLVLNDKGELTVVKPDRITANIRIDGREWKQDETFEVTVTPVGDAPAPSSPVQTLNNKYNSSHQLIFNGIMFTEPGTYQYVVSQTHGGETVDTLKYDVEKTVTFEVVKDDNYGIYVAKEKNKTVEFVNKKIITYRGIDFEPWMKTDSLPSSGSFYLMDDVTLAKTATIDVKVDLLLRGKTVILTGDGGSVIQVSGGELNLYDDEETGMITGGKNSGIALDSATFTMHGGTICNNTGTHGGGIYSSKSNVMIEEGTIRDNQASYGGGIYAVDSQSFAIAGGVITGNSAETYAPGIATNGPINILENLGSNVYNVVLIDPEDNEPMEGMITSGLKGNGTEANFVTDERTGHVLEMKGEDLQFIKIRSTETIAPTAKDLTYNGKDQKLIKAGESPDGKMVYALGNHNGPTESFSENIPTGKDADTYYVWYKVEGDAQHSDSAEKRIDVFLQKKPVTITPQDHEFLYNGLEHTWDKYDVEGLVGDDEIKAVVTGSVTSSYYGEAPNCVESYEFVTGKQSNYDIELNQGWLSVKPVEVTITANSASKEYDGTPLSDFGYTVTGLAEGDTHVFDVQMRNDSITNVGEYKNRIYSVDAVSVFNGYQTNVSPDYKVTVVDGTLKVTPRKLTITAQSKKFTYDGTTQSWAGYDVVGLVGSDAITAVTKGSITFPSEGSVANKIDSYEFTTGKAGNYSVTKVDGTLTMEKASNPITITAADGEWTYDGTAHLDDFVIVTIGKLFDGDKLEARAYSKPVTNVGDVEENVVKDGYKIMHGDEDVTENYVITCKSGTLSVKPKKVTITAKDASKEYDGTALTESGFTATDLEDGDTHEFTVEMTDRSTITRVGKQQNEIATVDGVEVRTGKEKAIGNYLVTTVVGRLEVVRNKKELFIISSTKSWTYDGTNHVDNSYVVTYDGEEVAADATGLVFTLSTGDVLTIDPSAAGVKNVGNYNGNNIFTYTLDNAANYAKQRRVYGTLSIDPAPLTITAQSMEFTYDGTAHEWSGYDVEGLIGMDAVTAVTSGTITCPSEGPVANEIASYEFTSGLAANYDMTKVDGALTMVNASQAITITAADGEWTYDGEAHSNASVTLTSGTLFSGDELVATANGSVTNVLDNGRGNNPVAEYKIMHGNEDVTANYVVTCEAGTLLIETAQVVITAQDRELVYDGTAQGWAGYDMEGLIGDDRIAAVTSGTITFPSEGTVANKIDSYEFTSGDARNYVVGTVDGALTMVNASQEITITAASDEWTYDGGAHTNGTVTVTGGTLFAGDELVATATGSVTNATDNMPGNNPVAEGYKIMHGDVDVTANYVITPVAGTLTIAAAQVVITAQDKELVYDGTAQGWSGYDVEGLIRNDKVTAVTSGTITFPSEGSVANKIDSYEFTSGDARNYVVRTVDGALTMVNASRAITITAADGEWTYDGKAHANTAVRLTGGSLFAGDTLVAMANGSVTNARDTKPGNNPVAEYKIMHGNEDVTANYVVTCEAGNLTIATAQVTITAQSRQFTYDGTAQGWAGYDVEGLIGNDNVTAVTSGTITFPSEGTIANKITSYEFTGGDALNYAVRTVDGKLTMANAANAITITAADGEWTYDGKAHGNSTVTLTCGTLFTGDELVATAGGSVTNVTDTKPGNNPVAQYKIMHGNVDVTASYVITTVAGTLKVNPNVHYTQDLIDMLWNVIAAGGKQTVYWSEGDALPFNIMKILQDHPQITLVFSYSYMGVNYRVAIPGSVAKAYPNIPWYGPLYLYGNYGMYNEDGSIKDGAVNPGVPGGITDGTLRTYVIRRGDTLSRIARRFGTTVRRLVDLNHIKNPNRIYAGHELIYEAQE